MIVQSTKLVRSTRKLRLHVYFLKITIKKAIVIFILYDSPLSEVATKIKVQTDVILATSAKMSSQSNPYS
jgi:hypothetical protein